MNIKYKNKRVEATLVNKKEKVEVQLGLIYQFNGLGKSSKKY